MFGVLISVTFTALIYLVNHHSSLRHVAAQNVSARLCSTLGVADYSHHLRPLALLAHPAGAAQGLPERPSGAELLGDEQGEADHGRPVVKPSHQSLFRNNDDVSLETSIVFDRSDLLHFYINSKAQQPLGV